MDISKQFRCLWTAILVCGIAAGGLAAQVGTTPEAICILADFLDAAQTKAGLDEGLWPDEESFTGSIVPGMISAFEKTGFLSYRVSAELGGTGIIDNAGGNFFGDEAYALMRLSSISPDPGSNVWRTAVADFFQTVTDGIGGTADYLADFAPIDPSTAVFFVSCLNVAAHNVDADDKALFRAAVIDYLATVGDATADFPVLALGIATGSLAQTGPLDATVVDSGGGEPEWSGVKLSDLPAQLASHQVLNFPYFGSFYYRFDHTDGYPAQDLPVSGWTEDTIFGAYGLLEVIKATGTSAYDTNIHAARVALLAGVRPDGEVFERLPLGGTVGGPDLRLSLSSDRSDSVLLVDQTVHDDIFVFVSPDLGPWHIDQVEFFIDDTGMAGTPEKIENYVPFDLEGTFDLAGTLENMNAKPYDTTQIADGLHTLTARIVLVNNMVLVRHSVFAVRNNNPTLFTFSGEMLEAMSKLELVPVACLCPGDVTDTETVPGLCFNTGDGKVSIYDLQLLANVLSPLSPGFSITPTPAELQCFDITDTDTTPGDGLSGPDGTLNIFDLQAMANYLMSFASAGFQGPCIP